jgi:hypothetical protein
VFARVRTLSGEPEARTDDNGLSNLVLLDMGTNRSYKNAVFPVMRTRIIDGRVIRRAAVTAERDRLVEAIAAGGAGLKVLVDGIAQREEQIKTLSARIEETQRLLHPRLVPRQLAEDDFAAGEASLFTGDVAKDKELLGKLLEMIVISSNGAIVVRFRDDTLFARVGSSVPTGGRADRRRDHAWDADVFAARHGDTAKSIIREVPGYRPRLRPASAAIMAPPGGGPGGTGNSISVPRGIRTLVATVKGWSPGPLDDGDSMDRKRRAEALSREGIEPSTDGLKARCSTG